MKIVDYSHYYLYISHYLRYIIDYLQYYLHNIDESSNYRPLATKQNMRNCMKIYLGM